MGNAGNLVCAAHVESAGAYSSGATAYAGVRSALDATEQIECSSVDNVLPLALYGLCIEFKYF